LKNMLLTAVMLSSITCASQAASPSKLPTVDDLAAAFRSGNMKRFSNLILNDPIAMRDNKGAVTALPKAEFINRLKGCELNRVFKAGVNYQKSDGLDWICRRQPVNGDACYVVSYGANLLPVKSIAAPEKVGFAISPLYLSEEYDEKKCGPMRPPAPRGPNG
jgi:hypothetical protein